MEVNNQKSWLTNALVNLYMNELHWNLSEWILFPFHDICDLLSKFLGKCISYIKLLPMT